MKWDYLIAIKRQGERYMTRGTLRARLTMCCEQFQNCCTGGRRISALLLTEYDVKTRGVGNCWPRERRGLAGWLEARKFQKDCEVEEEKKTQGVPFVSRYSEAFVDPRALRGSLRFAPHVSVVNLFFFGHVIARSLRSLAVN